MKDADVIVVGLGYVGLTLALALAGSGLKTLGVERRRSVVESLRNGRSPFREANADAALRQVIGDRLVVGPSLPEQSAVPVVLCTGTPWNPESGPDLRDLETAVEECARATANESLMVVRSTVPIGTCRNHILPILSRHHSRPAIAYCPERTIQGRALEEVVNLPQIVGANNVEAIARASRLFGKITKTLVEVSSLEVAEAVKLVNNAHTDVIYGFGNEVAILAERLGIDAAEIIWAANCQYPRPKIHRPGYVGGSCLTKDPHLLLSSPGLDGIQLHLIEAARRTNGETPKRTAERALAAILAKVETVGNCSVMISGFAYKGAPETDDVRGSPALDWIETFTRAGARILGHDHLVGPEAIRAMGAVPVTWAQGLAEAIAIIVLNNHEKYLSLTTAEIYSAEVPTALVYDAWGVLDTASKNLPVQVEYMRLGNGR